jgi:toxin YoeB
MYKITLSPEAFDDLKALQKNDKNDYVKCFDLFQAILLAPREGIGHPERLKYQENREVWSRKINKKDRIVYGIHETTETIVVLSCWGHYENH